MQINYYKIKKNDKECISDTETKVFLVVWISTYFNWHEVNLYKQKFSMPF